MTDLSLQQVLLDSNENLSDLVLETDSSREDLAIAQKNLSEKSKAMGQVNLSNEVSQHMNKLLDIPLDVILVRGWLRLKEVKQHVKKQAESGSDEMVVVYLLEHSIISSHAPSVDIRVGEGDAPIFTLQLDIALSLKLSGVALAIQYAKIQEITAGNCKGTGSISYKKLKLLEKDILSFNLPGKVHVSEKALQEEGVENHRQISFGAPHSVEQKIDMHRKIPEVPVKA